MKVILHSDEDGQYQPKVAHTPGPWRVDTHTGIPEVYSADHAVCQTRYGKPEDLANARLIAAAPELLAALKALIAHTGEVMDREGVLPQYLNGLGHKMELARVAVGKAEGK